MTAKRLLLGAGLIAILAIALALAVLASRATSMGDVLDDGGQHPISGVSETQWKSGEDWLAAPPGEPQPGPFLPGYQTPLDWLSTVTELPSGMTVVFTSDPEYNCGLAKAPKNSDWVVGCFLPQYGTNLFIWWGPDASDDMKKLIVLHEYSHFFQNWMLYDASHSAYLDGLYEDADFVQNVWEADATCRIYRDWQHSELEYLDSLTVSPCGDTDWSSTWFADQIEERGTTIEDW